MDLRPAGVPATTTASPRPLTVTPDRERRATFLPPYLISGQALAVDTGRLPERATRSTTSTLDDRCAARRHRRGRRRACLSPRGRAARVRVYDHGDIGSAIADLTTGDCDAVLALAPVLTSLVRAAAWRRSRPAGSLGRTHRNRGCAGRPDACRQTAGRSGRAGGGRHVAAHPAQMVGQPVCRPEPRSALNPVSGRLPNSEKNKH